MSDSSQGRQLPDPERYDSRYVDSNAKMLWDYLQLHQRPIKSDVLFCLCSHDVRVAERAVELFLEGWADVLVFSGGLGRISKGMLSQPEAYYFAEVAKKAGVPADKILTEGASTNTGENIRFTYKLLREKNVPITSMILVQKPYMERRTYAAFKKQWPDPTTKITVASPQSEFEEYLHGGVISKEEMISIMVGDMQRIREYPKLGFQIEQEIPNDVWVAYRGLVNQGFDSHLIKAGKTEAS